MIAKSSLIFLTFFISCFSYAGIPTLKSFVGRPLIQITDGMSTVIPEKDLTIEQSFLVKTAAKEQIKIQLGKDFYVIIFPESSLKVEAYYITKKDFKIKRIQFMSGRFYLKNGSNLSEDLTVTYESDLFVWNNTEKFNQREFFLEVNPNLAQVRFCAGEKGIVVQLFDHEAIKTLKYQQGAVFQGVLKNGDLQFDLLLQGRKIPRGEWKESFTCDFAQILKEMNDLEKAEEARLKKELQIKKAAEKKRKKEYEESLCHEPNGQFNDCLWKWEKTESVSRCIRYRCDGQGQWQDRQILPKNSNYHCGTKPIVKKCDY